MCEGKRVSNALYTLCNKSWESNVTSRLAHMTKPRSQTLDFSPDYAEAFLVIFMIDSTRTLVLCCILSAFSLDIALSLVCTRSHAHNSIFDSRALIGQCLNSWCMTF